MSVEQNARVASVPAQPRDPQTLAAEIRERVFALSLEFSRRAVEARSLEELCYLITNDIRALIEFDRAFLITHMAGQSGFVAASNQAILETKSEFNERLNKLAVHLKSLDKALLLKNPSDIGSLSDEAVPPELKQALASYVDFAKCTGMLCVPLKFGNEILGHMLLEYLDGKVPEQIQMVALVKLGPFFASALAQRWIFDQHPELTRLTEAQSWRKKPVVEFLSRHLVALVLAAVLLVALLFVIPFSYPVGGEAEIVPTDRRLVFCKMDGLIERINVTEGATVEEGQLIATLDPTELDFKTKSAQRQLELLTAEMTLLKKSSGQDVSKLAESRLVELKIRNVEAELRYLEWQRQFLRIKASASGVITTKHVDTFVGKKFKAGEPFCEIAVPGELCADIFVSEDKISRVASGQEGDLYLNNQPRTAYPIQVKEVAPRAEVLPRLGNIYRVRALFRGSERPPLRVGMKGVGTIHTDKASVYTIITQRLYGKWNQFALYFL